MEYSHKQLAWIPIFSEKDMNLQLDGFTLVNPDHFCEICSFTKEEQEQAFTLYLEWMQEDRIAAAVRVDRTQLIQHILAYAWDVIRGGHTAGYYRMVIREAGAIQLQNPTKISGREVTL